MNRQAAALVAAVCLAACAQDKEPPQAPVRNAVQERLEAERARLAAMTPEERAAEEQRLAAEREAKAQLKAEATRKLNIRRLREQGLSWNYQTPRDEMSGKPMTIAWVNSTNTVEFGFPYQGSQRATLNLRRHPRAGNDAILQIERGQFVCSSECSINVRFDDGEVQRFTVGEASDHRTTELFIQNFNRFLAQVQKAKEVRIAATIYEEGAPTFIFNVEGLDWK